MFVTSNLLSVLLITFCSLVTLGGIACLWRVRERQKKWAMPITTTLPPVTVLKPLKGVDDRLEHNLTSFFRQSYPEFQLVFGVEEGVDGREDPAVAVVRRLRARYPDVPCKLVRHDGGRGVNPKVSNLRAMMLAARHDVVLISDSNVEVPEQYLVGMASTLSERDVGLVTSLFAGTRERTLGGRLESLHLNGPIAAGVALSERLGGHTIAVGKSMMFRRRVFDQLGGFEALASLLAEDYVMGRMYRSAGFDVRLAPDVIHNVCANTTMRGFFMRHLRWGAIRSRMQPLLYPLEPLACPLAVGLVAVALGRDPGAMALWVLSLTVLRDSSHWLLLRGAKGLLGALPLGLPKEMITLAAWLAAPFQRHVSWRGNRVRLSAGTRLYAPGPMARPSQLVVEH